MLSAVLLVLLCVGYLPILAGKSLFCNGTTDVFCPALYCYLVCSGLGMVVGGIGEDSYIHVAAGSLFTLPTIVVCLLRRSIYGRLASSIAQNQRATDGLFMAALKDQVDASIKIGMKWWVFRPERSVADGELHSQWDPAQVIEVGATYGGEDGIVVQLASHCKPVKMTAEGKVVFPVSRSQMDIFIPRAETKRTPAEMLATAQKGLRLVPWECMSLGLLEKSTCDSPNQALSLTRSCKMGEIDVFLSHSWHDCPVTKWEVLQDFAQKFFEQNGRYPSIWLDKVCIDQTNIAEGLKSLSVSLMGCQTMLVLCGETYMQRLWCVLELLTLHAFDKNPKIIVHDISRPGREYSGIPYKIRSLGDRVRNFKLIEAHCFDPNEEDMILSVVDAGIGGRRGFEQTIRNLDVGGATGYLSTEAAYVAAISPLPRPSASNLRDPLRLSANINPTLSSPIYSSDSSPRQLETPRESTSVVDIVREGAKGARKVSPSTTTAVVVSSFPVMQGSVASAAVASSP